MNDFIPGAVLDESISQRITKYFIYKFFKCGIVFKTMNEGGIRRRRRVFSFRRPFSMEPEYLLSATAFVDELAGGRCYVLRHYKYQKLENPLFCVSKEELFDILIHLRNYSNYEYSYIFDASFKWCAFIPDDFDPEVSRLMMFKPL